MTYVRQRYDEVVNVGQFCRPYDVIKMGFAWDAVGDVLGDSGVEQNWFLAHHGNGRPQPCWIQRSDVYPVNTLQSNGV